MASEKNFKLELVQVLFRHGARTYSQIEALLPMPDYIDQSLIDEYDYQQLTNFGKTQAHNLGCVLRDRYRDFLGEVYRPREVFAYSSDFDRTKMSLQLVLAGLYPPPAEQTWDPDFKWMPIPYHHLPREFDVFLQTFRKPTYQSLLFEACQSETGKLHESTLMEMNDFFKDKGIYALEKYKFNGGMGIFNVLMTLKMAKSPLPSWYTEDLLAKMRQHVVNYLDIMSLTPEMKKLNCGPLIKKWIENMNLDGEEKSLRKIYLYSGHELNIAAFVRSHGVQEHFKYPDFSSAVVLEKLRDPENRVYVRLLAWTGNDGKFTPLKLGDFGEFCPIEEYLKLTQEVIPSDEEIDKIIQDDKIDLKELIHSDFVYASQTKNSHNRALPV